MQGPDRLFNVFVKPLFEATRQQMDSLGEEMSRVQDLAKEALPAVKQGDVAEVVAKTGAIAETVAVDSVQLAASVAGQLGESLQESVVKIERYWWKHGLLGAMERAIEKMEEARERAQSVLIQRWQARGPISATDKERLAPAESQSPVRGQEKEQSEPKAEETTAPSSPANEPTAEKAEFEQEEERKLMPGGVAAASESEPFASSALRRRRKSRRDDLADDTAAVMTSRGAPMGSAEEKRAASSSQMVGAPAKPVTPVPSAEAEAEGQADRPPTAATSQHAYSGAAYAADSASTASTLDKWHQYVKAALSKASASRAPELTQTQTKSRDSVEERKQHASS